MSEDEKENIRAFEYLGEFDGQYLYQNNEALPIAFMVKDTYADWTADGKYPWENQNSFAKATTGVTDELFSLEYMTGEPVATGAIASKQSDFSYHIVEDGTEDTALLVYTYQPTYQKERYIYYEAPHMSKLKVSISGNIRTYSDTRGHIVDLGDIGPQDTVTLTLTLDSAYTSADVKMVLFGLNEDIYRQVWGQLSQETLNIVDNSATSLKGTIDVAENGILYTSIPYDAGWTVRVDGQKVETKSLNGSLMYIELDAGTHEIEMSFIPQGFIPGLMISAGCLFILIVIGFRRKKFCENVTEL